MSDTELLERIANSIDKQNSTLERIEIVLEEKQNRTLESKEARELMQGICKDYKNTEPSYDIQVGSRLTVFRFRNTICKLKNIRNSKRDGRRLNKWIKLLEEKEFIFRSNADIVEVLDTGKDWGQL